jgi:SAM-dependent methyltransferase
VSAHVLPPADRIDDQLAANRANWDDRAAVHLASRFYDVAGWLRDQPGPPVRERDALGDVAGLDLVHLQCHFGLDTLQWARVGARVTGVDFSPAAIVAARDLAARAGLAECARFVCADVFDAMDALDGATFDVVYVSLGALCWLPSVDRWAGQVGALLRPGGRCYVHDGHPLSWALDDEKFVIRHSYFEEPEANAFDSDATYTDADHPIAHTRTYEWNHGIGEIVTALVAHGLQVDSLVEHDWTVWPRFPWLVPEAKHRWVLPQGMPRIPLTFTLLAHRATA